MDWIERAEGRAGISPCSSRMSFADLIEELAVLVVAAAAAAVAGGVGSEMEAGFGVDPWCSKICKLSPLEMLKAEREQASSGSFSGAISSFGGYPNKT